MNDPLILIKNMDVGSVPLQAIVPILYSLKTPENPNVFLTFPGSMQMEHGLKIG